MQSETQQNVSFTAREKYVLHERHKCSAVYIVEWVFFWGIIFVVFEIFTHEKPRVKTRPRLCSNAACTRGVYDVSECRFRAEYCTRGAVVQVEVSYGLISLL